MNLYPRRPSHFAHRVTRLLFKSCAVNRIGRHAALLVVHIVHTEDAARYRGPVTFWNSQLMDTLGFTSPKQLNNARKVAVEAGWLHYERHGTRAVGEYFVRIPADVVPFDDRPVEDPQLILSPMGTDDGTNHKETHSDPGTNGGTNHGTNSGKLPIPSPVPIPKRARATTARSSENAKFNSPTVDDVRAYAAEIRLSIDADRFVDHYGANGWKVGRSPMRDWRAAVRNWARREPQFHRNDKPAAPAPRPLTPPAKRVPRTAL